MNDYKKIKTYHKSPNDFSDEFYLSLPEAKELSKVLPKFLEEMERETK